MPKINAPTLAEHQAHQRGALVAAAVGILADEGVAALTPASAGRRASLARSSTYQYFDSGAALLATAVEAAHADLADAVARASASAEGPAAAISAFVDTVLSRATSTGSRALRALEHAELPPMCAARLHELAAERRAPLVAALEAVGTPDAGPTAELVDALVDAAAVQCAAGAPLGVVRRRVLTVLRGVLPAE
jgi:AcrR family transcriptional regulator